MLTPTSGEVRLCGRPITHLRDHDRAEVRRELVSLVLQKHALVEGMRVVENVFLPMVPRGGATREDGVRTAALMERFSMTRLAGAMVDELSAGERQRVAIIRALVMDTPVLLLDEPTSSLDTDNVRAMMATLIALRAEGRTILVTTHDQRVTDHPGVDGALRLMDGTLHGVAGEARACLPTG